MTQITRNCFNWKRTLSGLSLLALALSAAAAFAAVPTVVVDSELTEPVALKSPQSIVLAPNNTIYTANTGANEVMVSPPHTSSVTPISTAPYTLSSPNALAVDSAGDLFIGDSPTSGTGRVLEAMATNGALNGTVVQVALGSPLQDVTALALNPANTILYIGDDLSNAVYSLTLGGTPPNTPVKLDLTGVPAGLIPAALAMDSAGNLFVADFLTTLYEVPAGFVAGAGPIAAETYVATGFILNSPTGLAFDRKGDLYILTLGVPFGTTGGTPAEEILEVPGEDASSVFLVPYNNVGNATALATDTEGNLYSTDLNSGDIVALFYGSPVNLSQANVGSAGPALVFNYEFNATVTLRGFEFASAGDKSTEVADEGGTCATGKIKDGNNGEAISPSNPATCQESFSAQPAYPGFRPAAVELKGPSGTILNTTLVYSIGVAGASVVYPLTASAGATFNAPEGLAVSGLDKKLYVVDAGAAEIFSVDKPNGTTATQVNTGSLVLGIPYGLAIDGAGDLYVTDFFYSVIDVIPATASGQAPYSENPGGLLQHPLSAAFDVLGNLYIGDAGPDGTDADSADPGYVVEVPADGGAPFKVNTGATTIIFPESLTTDPYTGDLYIGDGGNALDESDAQVVKVAAATGAATVLTLPNVTQPVGIVFDAAEQLYVLDQNLDTITVVPPAGTPYLLPFDNSLFTRPVGLAITSGGQSLVESNVTDAAHNSLVYLNGLASPLAFGDVTDGQSSNLTATVENIGNLPLTLDTPYYTSNKTTTYFTVLGSSTCADGISLNPTANCSMNVQFTPKGTASRTAKFTLDTTGYNTGDSVIDLSGTGVK